MIYTLPKIGREAIALPHFPTRHQAFIFRAYEYLPAKKIAELLGTTEGKVHAAASDMGLPRHEVGDIWLKRGYITVIRRLWHILPYSQLLSALEMDEATLAEIMRNEDFLDIKLSDKPVCPKVRWRELTEGERERTKKIKEVVSALDFSGVPAFDFKYSVPKIEHSGGELFKTRMIYGFSELYQNAFNTDSRDYLPDSQLSAYRDLGINGIWAQGVLGGLAEFPFDKKASLGYEKRIERVRELTERLDKYGIKLYLYINEPRAMPLSFFRGRENIRGHIREGDACLCTSTPEVREYISEAIASICRSVPKLGGFFTITRSENMTNCYSHSGSAAYGECNCPRCKERSVGEVIGETVGAILSGVRRVSEDIKVFAWSWRWDEKNEEIIRHLPRGVILLSHSELDIPFERGGVRGVIDEYSMSVVGPGEHAKEEWAIARECGLETGAKVQVNTTWESSTVPQLPVAPLVEEHMRGLLSEGVSHLLLSWTLGGYPSANIAAAAKYFFEKCSLAEDCERHTEAQKAFAEAFGEFPFDISTLYFGPHNAGPSNLLFPEPTGYSATMTCFSYDDLDSWRSVYSEDAFEEQLRLLSSGWERGLLLLGEDESEISVMAHAAYCLFKSSHNQVRFIRERDRGSLKAAAKIAREELLIAKKMLSLMNKNAAIGYEAANHYYFSKGQLAEKIVNCEYIIELFENEA